MKIFKNRRQLTVITIVLVALVMLTCYVFLVGGRINDYWQSRYGDRESQDDSQISDEKQEQDNILEEQQQEGQQDDSKPPVQSESSDSELGPEFEAQQPQQQKPQPQTQPEQPQQEKHTQPQADSKPVIQPPISKPSDEHFTPIININQKLIIPISNGIIAPSKPVRQGILSGTGKQIALTFDAGWLYDQTIPLLNILEQHSVKSTFFPRGLWVKSNQDLAREIVKRGHVMENHSLTHGDMSKMTDQEIRNELRESTRIIKDIVGGNPYLFRPPYGAYNDRMLKILGEEGYSYTIMWTTDSHDSLHEIGGQKVTADYLVNRVLANASNNGIILMHIGGYNTIEALPRIIAGLREQGYKLVTVNEMLPSLTQGSTTHTVQAGETLYSISKQYGVTVQQIIDANKL